MRRTGERAWAWAVLAACVVALVAAHAPLIGYKAYANVDEAYACALAERLNEGFQLYVGAVSQRGPLMYYSFAALTRAFGWDNIVALRVAALLLCLLHVGLVTWAGTRFVSLRAGVLAGVVVTYALVVGVPPPDGMALHAEAMQVPLLLGGALAGLSATLVHQRHRMRWLVVSGLLFGLAIAIKQSAGLQPLPTALWLLVQGGRSSPRRFPLRELATFVLAVAAVPLAFVLHAAAIGTLRPFYFYTVEYNLHYHLRPSETMFSSASLIPVADEVNRLTSFIACTFAIVALLGVFLWRRVSAFQRERALRALLRGSGVRVYFALHFVVAFVTATAMSRFFPHYYVPAIPFLALTLAAWTQRPLARAGGAHLLGAIGAVLLIGVATATTYMNEKIDGRLAHDELPQRVGAYVAATTAPDARIFVWGFSPWLYGYAHRRPAGRFVFGTYVTGFVPWFYDALPSEPGRVVPGSMEALLGDLDQERPELVIDSGSVELARPLRAYPPLATWLDAGFCFEVRVGAYDIYRRKAAGADCSSASLPQPHLPVDWNGHAMHVSVPKVLSGPTLAPLCQPAYEDVAWFPDQPRPARVELLLDRGRAREPLIQCTESPRDARGP